MIAYTGTIQNAEGKFDGYTQMKQLDGGHQFCQGHAIAFAYYPEYRHTYEGVKEKEWFVNNDLLGAYEEAYIDILQIFKEILPIMLNSISKSILVKLINVLLTEQFADEYDGGEDPRYFKIIQKTDFEIFRNIHGKSQTNDFKKDTLHSSNKIQT